jgi:hypothetical protein
LFEPFFGGRGKSLCVCPWHEDGSTIEEAVPDLYKTIKGHPEWRAIILVHPQNEIGQNGELKYDPRNPFDFYCNRGDEQPITANPAPLVRLTHMLAGYPPLGVKGYEMRYTVYEKKSAKFKDFTYTTKDGKDNVLRQSNIERIKDDEKRKQIKDSLFIKYGGNIMTSLDEIHYSPKEKADHKQLTEMYALKENRPVEVIILSTREKNTADDNEATRESVRHAWQSYDEEQSSDFWKVYPSACRFICYDLFNPEHTLYSRDLWRFFLLALTLAVNQIPGQALQAYHLYKGDLNINTDELKYVLGGHIENLLSIQAIIRERMLRVADLTQDKKKELVPTRNISVKFENVDEGDVKADGDRLGLAADCPISETRFWYDHIQGTKQTIDSILCAPQEIVVGKALETRMAANSFIGIEQVLDRFQLERIRKNMDELEPRVINSHVYGILDADVYKAEVAEAGDAVRKFIGLRLTKRNILLISLFSLLVYLCGYIPYLINSAKISLAAFGAAFGLVAIALVFLAAAGLLTLWFLRRRLVHKLKAYNKTVRGIFDRVNKGAKIFSEYFSSVCTYMYARSLLSGVILKNDNDYTAAKMLKAHLAFLESEIEANRELCALYGVPANNFSMSNAFMDIKEESLLEMPSESRFYELAPNRVKGTLELDRTGETLDAPYSFIAVMSLTREEIYDKKGA